MTKLDINAPRTAGELRKFALSVGLAFIVVFGMFLPWVLSKSWPLWPWILAAILIVWGFVHPLSLQPVYRGWMFLGVLLHKIVSPVVLGLMFYIVFTPISVLLRLYGKKLIDTGFDESAVTYRNSVIASNRKNYERPF